MMNCMLGVLVLDDGQAKLALVVCDLRHISAEVAANAKQIIQQTTGIPPQCVLISATHTHTSTGAKLEEREGAAVLRLRRVPHAADRRRRAAGRESTRTGADRLGRRRGTDAGLQPPLVPHGQTRPDLRRPRQHRAGRHESRLQRPAAARRSRRPADHVPLGAVDLGQADRAAGLLRAALRRRRCRRIRSRPTTSRSSPTAWASCSVPTGIRIRRSSASWPTAPAAT